MFYILANSIKFKIAEINPNFFGEIIEDLGQKTNKRLKLDQFFSTNVWTIANFVVNVV